VARHGRIIFGFVLLLILVGAGFAAGYFTREKQAAPGEAQSAEAESTKPPKPNHKTYEVSPPSIGPVLVTVPVEPSFFAGMATVTMNPADAAEIKTGQQALLYDVKGKRLDLLAKVMEISQPENAPDAEVTITLLLPPADFVKEGEIKKAEIITDRDSYVSRLPASAVFRKNGETYAWEIAKNEDGSASVWRKAIQVHKRIDDFVVMTPFSNSSNVFVLHPDDRLEEGQKINTKETLWQAPDTPDYAVETAYQKHVQDSIDRVVEYWRYRDPGGHSSPAPGAPNFDKAGGVTPMGCGAPPNATQEFIYAIQKASGQPLEKQAP
jgi:hypothetical protein